jgi:1,4-dihydroxy-6-naphthoate synthase
MHFTLGHSPDPDDAFMFYALAKNKIDAQGHTFEHILQDIEQLNQRAFREELDITAFSIHAYAYLSDKYALTACGASMGDNYGPRLVAKNHLTKAEIAGKKIAVPGRLTSAALALQLYLGKPLDKLDWVEIPFDQIFDAVEQGKAEVGLLIHEGQLTYKQRGFTLCEDLGAWWFQETGGLPLPLGGNGVRRSLGMEKAKEISKILKASIAYGLAHRKAGVEYALPFGRDLNEALADEFIGMYVNDLTVDYGERGRAGIREFLGRAAAAGLIPQVVDVQFVD